MLSDTLLYLSMGHGAEIKLVMGWKAEGFNCHRRAF